MGRVAFRPLETWLEEGFRRRAAAVTVTSRTLAERARAIGVAPERVHYVPSGANVRTVTVRDRAECRRALGLAPDGPIACFVGFVQYDLERVVRAFATVRERVPEARLVLVGPKHRAAGELAARLGLAGAVVDLGPRPFAEIPTCLGAADVLLLPMSDNLMNRARGPIKLGDYLAAGRAVVADPVGDLVALFAQDDIGLLAGGSSEAFGAAIAELLLDPERCRRLGARAREVAEQKIAWSRLAPALVEVYRGALGATQRAGR